MRDYNTPTQYPPPQPVYYPYPVQRQQNSLATVTLVLGIISLFFWPLALVVVILAHLAIWQIDTRFEDGKGQAVAAAVLGWIGTAGLLGFVILLAVV